MLMITGKNYIEHKKWELKKIIRETKEREHNLKICILKIREGKVET